MVEMELKVPITENDVRRLRVGDIVYLTGIIQTLRSKAHKRIIEYLNEGKRVPFTIKDGAIWHCGPIARKIDEKWEVTSAGSTSSFSLSKDTPRILKELRPRLVIGKGFMGEEVIDAMKHYGAAYLASVGGCAALYAQRIKEVAEVYWLDLGMVDAVWNFDLVKFGPLTVSIDAHGNSLINDIKRGLDKKLVEIYNKWGIDPGLYYAWWPPFTVGTPEASKHATSCYKE